MYRKRAADSKQPRETSLEGFASTCSVVAVGLFVLTFLFQNFVIHHRRWRALYLSAIT
jgi:hypothetical protein